MYIQQINKQKDKPMTTIPDLEQADETCGGFNLFSRIPTLPQLRVKEKNQTEQNS